MSIGIHLGIFDILKKKSDFLEFLIELNDALRQKKDDRGLDEINILFLTDCLDIGSIRYYHKRMNEFSMGCSRAPNEPGTTQLKRILNTFSLSCSPRKKLDVVLVGPLLPAQKITLQKKYGAAIIPAKLHWHLAQQEKLRSDLHRASPNAAFIYDWEDVLYQVSTSEINPYLFPFFRQQSNQTILLTQQSDPCYIFSLIQMAIKNLHFISPMIKEIESVASTTLQYNTVRKIKKEDVESLKIDIESCVNVLREKAWLIVRKKLFDKKTEILDCKYALIQQLFGLLQKIVSQKSNHILCDLRRFSVKKTVPIIFCNDDLRQITSAYLQGNGNAQVQQVHQTSTCLSMMLDVSRPRKAIYVGCSNGTNIDRRLFESLGVDVEHIQLQLSMQRTAQMIARNYDRKPDSSELLALPGITKRQVKGKHCVFSDHVEEYDHPKWPQSSRQTALEF